MNVMKFKHGDSDNEIFASDAKLNFFPTWLLTLIVHFQWLIFQLRHTNKNFLFETLKTPQNLVTVTPQNLVRKWLHCKHLTRCFSRIIHNANLVNARHFLNVLNCFRFFTLFNFSLINRQTLLSNELFNCVSCDVSPCTSQQQMKPMFDSLLLIFTMQSAFDGMTLQTYYKCDSPCMHLF